MMRAGKATGGTSARGACLAAGPDKPLEWVYCPVCGGKTRIKIRDDTELYNFPLYCPRCKRETLVEIKRFQIKRI